MVDEYVNDELERIWKEAIVVRFNVRVLTSICLEMLNWNNKILTFMKQE